MKQDNPKNREKQKNKASNATSEKSGIKTTIASPAKPKAPAEAIKTAVVPSTVIPISDKSQPLRSTEKPNLEGPLAPVTPIAVALHNRDRRNNSEGRRGRFAEKIPPGTRTKMLKIIYERKQEIQEKKRYQLIIKICVAVVFLASLFFAGKAMVTGIYDLGAKTYQSLEVHSWLDRLSVPIKVQVPVAPAKTLTTPKTDTPKPKPVLKLAPARVTMHKNTPQKRIIKPVQVKKASKKP